MKVDLSALEEHEEEFRKAVLKLADVRAIEKEIQLWINRLDWNDPSLELLQIEELFRELSYCADRGARICEIARRVL